MYRVVPCITLGQVPHKNYAVLDQKVCSGSLIHVQQKRKKMAVENDEIEKVEKNEKIKETEKSQVEEERVKMWSHRRKMEM